MTKLSVAVIGCGVQGRVGHLTGWRQTEGVEVVAVRDVNLERAKQAAQEFEVPHVYDDPQKLLENHKQNVVDAFAAGNERARSEGTAHEPDGSPRRMKIVLVLVLCEVRFYSRSTVNE
jgi:threonine dehydrogenase-like Zn-dependent dehydrogenase